MNGKDLKKARELAAALKDIDRAAASMMQEETTQAEDIRKCCDAIRLREARSALSSISVEELRNSKAGIRVSALQAAGYKDLGAISRASDRELTMADGIGEGQLQIIRSIISGFTLNLSRHKSIRIPDQDLGKEESLLLMAVACCRRCSALRKEMRPYQEILQDFTRDMTRRLSIKNSFQWFFSGREKKEQTEEAFGEIFGWFNSPDYEAITDLLRQRNKAVLVTADEALQDFRKNGAEYYALLSVCGVDCGDGSGAAGDKVES